MTPATGSGRRTVDADGIGRVEGEGSLRLEIDGGTVTDVALDIFEPPRYFEALLVGRDFHEAPDLTARICGICPVAYQLSACAAMEDACGVEVSDRITALRRLLYCGEWIQSHALHVYLLHAPDFLGYPDAVAMAEHHRAEVERGLALKRAGNLVMTTVGGRAVHPVNVRVGGFYRSPDRDTVAALADPLRRARDDALATAEWVAGFEFPEVSGDYRFVSLRGGERYPIEGGRPAISDGRHVTPAQLAALVVEEHVARSTALHARLEGRFEYLTGPLARFALNADLLPSVAADAAAAAGLRGPCTNPFRSIVVRAVELVAACDEALALVEAYAPPEPPAVAVTAPAGGGVGYGVTEAPRGLLLHRYDIDAEGTIRLARIVPPTSQNQLTIEADLRRTAQWSVDQGDDDDALRHVCEQSVRNHDPCISCAAHFLDLRVVRR